MTPENFPLPRTSLMRMGHHLFTAEYQHLRYLKNAKGMMTVGQVRHANHKWRRGQIGKFEVDPVGGKTTCWLKSFPDGEVLAEGVARCNRGNPKKNIRGDGFVKGIGRLISLGDALANLRVFGTPEVKSEDRPEIRTERATDVECAKAWRMLMHSRGSTEQAVDAAYMWLDEAVKTRES